MFPSFLWNATSLLEQLKILLHIFHYLCYIQKSFHAFCAYKKLEKLNILKHIYYYIFFVAIYFCFCVCRKVRVVTQHQYISFEDETGLKNKLNPELQFQHSIEIAYEEVCSINQHLKCLHSILYDISQRLMDFKCIVQINLNFCQYIINYSSYRIIFS